MTNKDEIYDHLAQVYLGKKNKVEEKRKNQFNAWLVINIVITLIIFASSFYGFTAFLTKRGASLHNNVIFALTNSPLRIIYNLDYPYPPVKTFSLAVPKMNVTKYRKLNFSIRGMEEAYPGVVKLVLKNQKNEISSYLIKDVRSDWQEYSIPFEAFAEITDWTNLTDISFIFEAWNAEKKKGAVLIDNLCFSSLTPTSP